MERRKCQNCQPPNRSNTKTNSRIPEHIEYESLTLSQQEFNLIDKNLNIQIAMLKLSDLLAVLMTIKRKDDVVRSKMFKEWELNIDKETHYMVFEGNYKLDFKLSKLNGEFTIQVDIERYGELVYHKIFSKY